MNTSALIENLKSLFNECDTDKNGILGPEEFKTLCNKIGLNDQAAADTFSRLDIDQNGKITFDEFAAGFQQYSKSSPNAPQPKPPQAPHQSSNQTNPVSRRQEPSKTASPPPIATKTPAAQSNIIPQASTSSTVTVQSQKPPPAAVPRRAKPSFTPSPVSARARVSKSVSPYSTISLGASGTSGSSADLDSRANSSAGLDSEPANLTTSTDSGNVKDSVVVFSSDSITNNELANNGGGSCGSQFGSLISTGSGNQLKSMQDLLDCVQKLQSENQILSQIFFKDKREREEYINQLGEEFDLQVREVEERANKRAREELENEKKRLRDMMQAERETLEHHYNTIEKMSKMITSSNGRLDEGHESIDEVKSKLEDTFHENRQLKKSLLDTKSDVALIRKEMEKLKRQYEERLSNAYEKNMETKGECDHLKQQLNLMKDSNRKLQDASDMITTYITDRVEPAIKGTEEDYNYLSPGGGPSLNGSNRMGASSQSNSRRGSILSEYIYGNDQTNSIDGYNASNNSGDIESLGSSQGRPGTSGSKTEDIEATGQMNKNPAMKQSLTTASTQIDRRTMSNANSQPNLRKNTTAQSISEETSSLDKFQPREDASGNKTPQRPSLTTRGSLRNLGRHFFIGARAQSDAELAAATESKEEVKVPASKSVSVDGSDEVIVEPSDGPSRATFNIILVGDSFVGKSSFAARFMEGTFVQGLISNCSIDFKTKAYKVDGVNYTINLWDTAGQERFRSITASYFRKADGIILMYDVTDRRSYLNVRNWMSTISDTASENVAVLLIGNKIDLRRKEIEETCVPAEEGYRLAREYDIVFLETSVKNGMNLVPSMGKLIRLIAKNNMPQEDEDRIRLNDKSRSFHCMPKNC